MLDGPGTAFVTRNLWVRVPPPALVLSVDDAGAGRPGGRLQPDYKAGSTPAGVSDCFRCSSGGESVALKPRRPLVRPQPPELLDRVGVRPGVLVVGPWKRRAPRSFRFDSCAVRCHLLSRSTTVVRLAVNQTVAGSIPAGTAEFCWARCHPTHRRAPRATLAASSQVHLNRPSRPATMRLGRAFR